MQLHCVHLGYHLPRRPDRHLEEQRVLCGGHHRGPDGRHGDSRDCDLPLFHDAPVVEEIKRRGNRVSGCGNV